MKSEDSVLKSRDINKGLYSQGYGLPRGDVWLWQLDCKEGRVPKNWCLQTVVLEETPESPLDCKEIKRVNLKGNQTWILIGRTDAEAETPKIEGRRRRGHQKMRWLDGITSSIDMHWANFKRGWGTGRPGVLQSMGLQRVGHNWVNEQQQQKTWSVLWFMGWLTTVGLQGGTGFRNVKYIAENQNQLTFLAS